MKKSIGGEKKRGDGGQAEEGVSLEKEQRVIGTNRA